MNNRKGAYGLLAEMRGLRHLFKWRLFGNKIRGYRTVRGQRVCFCPLTALLFAETGRVFNPQGVGAAARALGIKIGPKNGLVAAADYEHAELRHKLELGLGLTKP